jgi:hypothetical protein
LRTVAVQTLTVHGPSRDLGREARRLLETCGGLFRRSTRMRLLHYSRSTWTTPMLPVHPWSALGPIQIRTERNARRIGAMHSLSRFGGVWRVWVSDTAKANRPKSTSYIYAP